MTAPDYRKLIRDRVAIALATCHRSVGALVGVLAVMDMDVEMVEPYSRLIDAAFQYAEANSQRKTDAEAQTRCWRAMDEMRDAAIALARAAGIEQETQP